MTLRPREKKFLIAAFVAFLAFVLLEFVVLPEWERVQSTRGSLVLAQKELRYDRELVAAKQLRDQQSALQAQLTEREHHLLVGPDTNQASAELQTWLSQRAAEQQLGLVRSEFLAPNPVGDDYVRIPVRLELNGRVTQLSQFVSAILGGERIVEIEELQISSTGDKDKRVHCGVVIAALMRKPR